MVLEPDKSPVVIATVGGSGTRMYPLTLDLPKPLIPICNYPILRRMLEILANQGCREFIFASTGAGNTLRLNDYFGWGLVFSAKLGLEPPAVFRYQPNYKDKGSADAVRACMGYFNVKRDVLVIGGDHIMDIDLEKLMQFHREKGAVMTIGLMKVDDVSQYGVADMGEDCRIKRFVEKPAKGKEPSNLANIGVYVLSPNIRDIFGQIDPDVIADFGYNLLPYLTRNGYDVYGYVTDGYWNDVGTIERYLQTTQDLLHKKVGHIKLKIGSYGRGERVVHETTLKRIGDRLENNDIEICGNVMIGGDCEIGSGVKIEDSCIGDNCIIGDGVTIRGSVVMNFTNIDRDSLLNKCIVASYSNIGKGCRIDGEMEVDSTIGRDRIPVIGENVSLFDRSVIGPGKRVAPIAKSHCILRTGRFIELGMDEKNIYFIEK
ncbi:MAG: hypothetical protein MSIBF_06665 [Candidatus Altiarchaeales archaeon IMC4]|nr:MAG: hypothetical protein MSIBF_06665 [Candidatus Altiarchaeales archaeon IMC4]